MEPIRVLGRPYISLLVLAGLVSGTIPAVGANFEFCDVVLMGPSECWVETNVTFTAAGFYGVDAATQQEIQAGTATVEFSWDWSYAPGNLVAGGGSDDSSVTINYDYEDGGAYQGVSVEWTVTITWNGGSIEASASDSKTVKVKRLQLSASGPGYPICAGAIFANPHKSTLSATVENGFGEPVSGATVSFGIVLDGDIAVETPPAVNPTSVLTNQLGVAVTNVISSDKETTFTARAWCGSHPFQTDSEDYTAGLPDAEISVSPRVIPRNGSTSPQVALTFDGDGDDLPVPSHSLIWRFVSIYDAQGNLVYDRETGTGSTDGYGTVNSPSVSNAQGIAATTYTAGSNPGTVILDVYDNTCYNADEEHPSYGSIQITVCKLIDLVVDPGYRLEEPNDEDWVTSIDDGEYVTVTAVIEPPVSGSDVEGIIQWTGGEAVSGNALQRRVSRSTAALTPVTCQLWMDVKSAHVYVCAIQSVSLVSGAASIDSNNGATEADTEDTSGVVLQANLSPNPPDIPTQLLMWSRGEAVPGTPERRKVLKTAPERVVAECRCGDSSDTYTVWVIRIDLDVAGVSEDDEQTAPGAKLKVNSDDDNVNSTQDKDDTAVTDENDLISASIRIEPAGVPGGTVSLAHTARLELWLAQEKETLCPTSWDLATTSLPETVWVEGLLVSANPGDQSLTMDFQWSTLNATDQQVLATVEPRNGTSEAYLKVFRSYEDPVLSDEAYSPIGGTVYPTLYLKVGEGERVKPGQTSLQVVVTDEYENYDPQPDVTWELAVALNSAEGWQVRNGQGGWEAATQAPGSLDNLNGATPIYYRRVLTWTTVDQPLGNNGTHSVATSAEVEFQEYVVGQGWTNDSANGPTAKSTTVENLWISDVTCSNGTVDYFKWDPDGPTELTHPTIAFTIEDADAHTYDWVIYYRSTSFAGTWEAGCSAASGTASTPGTVTVDLGDANTQGHLDAEAHEWGTYTYDIVVTEVDGAVELDRQGYKEPYCLSVPEDAPDGDGDHHDGHDAWIHVDDYRDPVQMRGQYWLNDQSGRDAKELELIPVDSQLTERAPYEGARTVGEMHAGVDGDGDGSPDGLTVYEFTSSDTLGTWRVLWTGEDACGVFSQNRRSHDNPRMLVANRIPASHDAYVLTSGDEILTGTEELADEIEGRLAGDARYNTVAKHTRVGPLNYHEPLPGGGVHSQTWAERVFTTMSHSSFFHFYGHGLRDNSVVSDMQDHGAAANPTQWIRVSGPGDDPGYIGVYAFKGYWTPIKNGRIKYCVGGIALDEKAPDFLNHAHVIGCSTAVGTTMHDGRSFTSVADWFVRMGARSAAGTRRSPLHSQAGAWVDWFYNFACYVPQGKDWFDHDLGTAIGLACQKMTELYGTLTRPKYKGYLVVDGVPQVKYIGPSGKYVRLR